MVTSATAIPTLSPVPNFIVKAPVSTDSKSTTQAAALICGLWSFVLMAVLYRYLLPYFVGTAEVSSLHDLDAYDTFKIWLIAKTQ